MEIVTLIGLLAFPSKMVGVIKTLKAGDKETAMSTGLLIAITIATLFLAANANSFEGWVLVDQFGPLGSMDAASIVIVGLLYGSAAAKAYDFQNAFDDKSSAAEPRLLAPPSS